jgi:hypothetical protein
MITPAGPPADAAQLVESPQVEEVARAERAEVEPT